LSRLIRLSVTGRVRPIWQPGSRLTVTVLGWNCTNADFGVRLTDCADVAGV
jgi:hypothetical protein